MRVLKQSTQVDVLIGPLIDNGDFKAVEESVAYNATGIDVDVIKGVTKADVSLANSAGDGYWRHVANGYYAVTLSTTDTGTLGPLRVAFEATGVLPCWEDFLVVPANVYDAMVAGTDYLKSDAVEISSSSTAADNVEANIGNLDASIAGLDLGGSSLTVGDIADAVWDEAQSGHTTAGTFGSYLDAKVSTIAGTTGSGADECTITIAEDGVGVPGATVWITTDAAGNTVVAEGKRTNDSGQVTLFLDDGSAYYLWAQCPAGFKDIHGQPFTAVAD